MLMLVSMTLTFSLTLKTFVKDRPCFFLFFFYNRLVGPLKVAGWCQIFDECFEMALWTLPVVRGCVYCSGVHRSEEKKTTDKFGNIF